MRTKILVLTLLVSTLSFAINSQSYFKDTFEQFKADLKSRAEFIKKSNPNAVLGRENLPITTLGDNAPNYIDYFFVPSKTKKNLIIIQSGVHGIEGLAGASIQNFLLEYLHIKQNEVNSYLYTHLVNPTGTFHGRRTNINNVDLNRNFVIKDSDFLQTNDDYAKIDGFLNPGTPFESGFFKKVGFYFDSFYLIYQHSVETLRRSILKGQYSFPKGLYFGAKEYQPEFHALKKIWDAHVDGYQKIVFIDLHTGYGEKGKLHLLSGNSESPLAKKLEKLMSPSTIDFGNKKNFYETTGDVSAYFATHYQSQSEIYPVTFEFGTLNSQSTLGSLDSLYRMRSENQAHQNGTDNEDSKKNVRKLFREMFYPSEFEWRDRVLIQTKAEMDKIVTKLEDSSF